MKRASTIVFGLATLMLGGAARADDPTASWTHDEEVRLIAHACGLTTDATAAEQRATLPCQNKALAELRELKALSHDIWLEGQPDWTRNATTEQLDGLEARRMAAFARIQEIRADLKAPLVQLDADAYRAAVHTVVVEEKACRVNAKCMNERAAKKREREFFSAVVEPMCTADKQREEAQADIAHEKANPAGVVDLHQLYLDGEIVQQTQEQITSLKPQYVAFRKHAWRGWRAECAAE